MWTIHLKNAVVVILGLNHTRCSSEREKVKIIKINVHFFVFAKGYIAFLVEEETA